MKTKDLFNLLPSDGTTIPLGELTAIATATGLDVTRRFVSATMHNLMRRGLVAKPWRGNYARDVMEFPGRKPRGPNKKGARND